MLNLFLKWNYYSVFIGDAAGGCWSQGLVVRSPVSPQKHRLQQEVKTNPRSKILIWWIHRVVLQISELNDPETLSILGLRILHLKTHSSYTILYDIFCVLHAAFRSWTHRGRASGALQWTVGEKQTRLRVINESTLSQTDIAYQCSRLYIELYIFL